MIVQPIPPLTSSGVIETSLLIPPPFLFVFLLAHPLFVDYKGYVFCDCKNQQKKQIAQITGSTGWGTLLESLVSSASLSAACPDTFFLEDGNCPWEVRKREGARVGQTCGGSGKNFSVGKMKRPVCGKQTLPPPPIDLHCLLFDEPHEWGRGFCSSFLDVPFLAEGGKKRGANRGKDGRDREIFLGEKGPTSKEGFQSTSSFLFANPDLGLSMPAVGFLFVFF